MMAVDRTDPTSPGAAELLWVDPYMRDPAGNAAQNFDVHGDGPRFLMGRVEEVSPGRVHVVLNWFEELRERLPR